MGTHRLVYIRTDANSRIATGHLVRCLSVADALFSLGAEVCFLVSDDESGELFRHFLSSASCKPSLHVLQNAAYDNLEKELPELTALLAAGNCGERIFLLDSYYVTEKYLRTVKSYVKTAYLDDLRLFDYPVDLVINYDVIPPSSLEAYKKSYGLASRCLLGSAYAPLRTQFQKPKSLRSRVSHVLITTGGSDPYHFCLRFLEAFQEKRRGISGEDTDILSSLELQLVIGCQNGDREALYRLQEELPFLHLHENVSHMASLMAGCDLAVAAAGTTLYELCAVGVPAISYTMADNQLPAAEAFAEADAVPLAGDIRDSFASVLTSVLEFMTDMSENEEKRKSAHQKMHALVDGKGALRIAEALYKL